MKFHIGQKITLKFNEPWDECVSYDDEIYPEYGVIYTVRTIEPSAYAGAIFVIRLVEIVNKKYNYERGYLELSYDADEFEAVVETKSEVSFTIGADPDSEKWDNRKVKVK